jgi:hypothetical protein
MTDGSFFLTAPVDYFCRMANRTILFQMFQDTLHLVIMKYGTRYWNNPEFTNSPDKDRLVRLAEMAKEESGLEIDIDPSLN